MSTEPSTRPPTPEQDAFERLIAGQIEPIFQPLVDLVTGETAGYEALARGPAGPLQSPGAMFELARRLTRVRELDWACRDAAIARAREVSFCHPLTLFINAEPEALGHSADSGRWASFADLRCHAEVTERELAANPAGVLRAIDQVREQDWGIALDDIGADQASLALLPVLRPDVMKLDLRLLHGNNPATNQVVYAVLAQAERTGATVVAEGIETEQQLDRARAWGVRLGQGWLLGRPAPLPAPLLGPVQPVRMVGRVVEQSVLQSPFALLSEGRHARRVTAAALAQLVHDVEGNVSASDGPVLLLACYPQAELYDPASRMRHADLQPGLPLIAVLSPDRLVDVPAGIVVRQLDPDDPARQDWDLVVLSNRLAVAIASRPTVIGDRDGPHNLVTTFDPDLVARAAYALLARLNA